MISSVELNLTKASSTPTSPVAGRRKKLGDTSQALSTNKNDCRQASTAKFAGEHRTKLILDDCDPLAVVFCEYMIDQGRLTRP